MKNFKYEGLSSSGAKIEGVIEAFDEQEALTKIRENCRVITKITPISGAASANSILNMDIGQMLGGGKIKDKELSLLCSQLAIELKAGLPIVRCLRLVAENQKKNKVLAAMMNDVADNVHSGHGLADSFALHSKILPNAFIETVRAGEESGKLDESFTRLKVFFENQAGVKSKVVSAMIYPILLIVVAVVVVLIIMIKAVPVFTSSFADMGAELPGVTKAMIATSNFFVNYWMILLVIVIALALAINIFGKTAPGRRLYATIALKFPGVGLVNTMSAASNFCATMSTMLSSGLPLVQSLKITADCTDNTLISQDIYAARQGVIEGNRMGDGLKKSKWLPSLLLEMAAVGEETGNLEETLDVVSDYYTKEVDTAVKRALGILEPAIVLVMAGLVVFILLSVYLPLFSMYGSI